MRDTGRELTREREIIASTFTISYQECTVFIISTKQPFFSIHALDFAIVPSEILGYKTS